jgi:hypothetical protein
MADSSKSIGNMIESIVRSELTNELQVCIILHSLYIIYFQATSEQQNKQFAEKKEQNLKGLRDEVKRSHSLAIRLDNELEQELNKFVFKSQI